MNTFIQVEVWKFLVATALYVIAGSIADKRYWIIGLAMVSAATLLVVL